MVWVLKWLKKNREVVLSYLLNRYLLVVRIAGSQPAGPGSNPGNGNFSYG